MNGPPHSHTLLLVGEDDTYRTVLVVYLERQGFTVKGVPSVGHVLGLLREGMAPCAILIDLRLLGEPGWVLAEHLHRDPATTHIPVILVAGSVRDAARAIRVGARQFLSKPATPAEIATVVGEFCPRT